MPALGAGIHVLLLLPARKTRMAGTSPAITNAAFMAHTLRLLFPLLITIGKQWIGAGDHFLHLQVASSHQARTLVLGSFRQNARAPPPSC
jgi:hypothetical protein